MLRDHKLDINRDKIRGLVFQAKYAVSSNLLHQYNLTPSISALPNGVEIVDKVAGLSSPVTVTQSPWDSQPLSPHQRSESFVNQNLSLPGMGHKSRKKNHFRHVSLMPLDNTSNEDLNTAAGRGPTGISPTGKQLQQPKSSKLNLKEITADPLQNLRASPIPNGDSNLKSGSVLQIEGAGTTDAKDRDESKLKSVINSWQMSSSKRGGEPMSPTMKRNHTAEHAGLDSKILMRGNHIRVEDEQDPVQAQEQTFATNSTTKDEVPKA